MNRQDMLRMYDSIYTLEETKVRVKTYQNLLANASYLFAKVMFDEDDILTRKGMIYDIKRYTKELDFWSSLLDLKEHK